MRKKRWRHVLAFIGFVAAAAILVVADRVSDCYDDRYYWAFMVPAMVISALIAYCLYRSGKRLELKELYSGTVVFGDTKRSRKG